MKIIIDDIFPAEQDIPYKFIIESSLSEELKRICNDITEWDIDKQVVIIITIDETNKSQTDLIIKIARGIIRAVKDLDYIHEIITTVKYEDLRKIIIK